MKKYFTIDEAASYLTTPTLPFDRRDILDLAMREKLRLAFWFDGELHRFRSRFGGGYDDPPDGDPEAWHVSARGYFCVPAWQISPDSPGVTIDNVEPIEPPISSSRAWRTGSLGYVLGAISWDDGEARHAPIRIGVNALFVPAEDVEALSCSEASAALPTVEGDGGRGAREALTCADGLVQQRVAWQRVLLEFWSQVAVVSEGKVRPRDAMKWLKKNGPRDVIPVEQPDSESMKWITGGGNIQTVSLRSIQNRISEWKKEGILPA